jgi:hypothetical protein
MLQKWAAETGGFMAAAAGHVRVTGAGDGREAKEIRPPPGLAALVYPTEKTPMNVRTIVGATALTLVLSASAFAATTVHPVMKMKPHPITVSARCITLETQFTQEVRHHIKAKWLKIAEKLDAKGTQACSAGHSARGKWDLRAALRDIGVTPKV